MDSAVGTAARALSAGDPLSALKHVALRSDPSALALRGIAFAQLGELGVARQLLRRAARGFGDAEPKARARCVVAQAEIALAERDLAGAAQGLQDAVKVLARRGDVANAALGRLVQVRRAVWLGRLDEAEGALERLSLAGAPARFVAIARLVRGDIAMKRLRAKSAEVELSAALNAARESRISALVFEAEQALERFRSPVARVIDHEGERQLRLPELEALAGSRQLLLDLGRRELRRGPDLVSFVTRPLLLELLAALAENSPADVPREALITRVFAARRPNESHRVRLRVEVGRLRRLLAAHADVTATAAGYVLVPHAGSPIVRLLPLRDDEASALWALLQTGQAWATSALSAALGKSQRSVQRALGELEAQGKVRGVGGGRSRRWVVQSGGGFATTLLLVAPGTLG